MMTGFFRIVMIALFWSVPLTTIAQQPATAPTQPLLKEAELEQLVAPIALHPDPLLSEILIASTYPLEVVQADRWAKSNKGIKGDALTAALAKQSWDDSVKSLAQLPNLLAMMSDQLDWTQKLGDAVLAQQADVMDAIQRLRARARANGKLESSKEQTVTVKSEGEKQYVAIEPTSPTEIYVPYYEPAMVYGDWPYPDYAPYYFPPPYGYIAGGVLATGIAFATAVAVRHALWGNCDWRRRNINVVSNRSVNIANISRSNWEHNADHRHGVKYNNADVRQKFAKTDIQAGKGGRQDFRGKDGQKVLEPDRGRPAAADRDRPAVSDRDRYSAGDRDRSQTRNADRGKDAGRAGAGKTQRPNQQPAQKTAQRPSQRPSPKAAQRPSERPSQPRRDTAFSGVQSGAPTQAQANRGRQSMGGRGGAPRVAQGGGRGGGRGGARRSDVALKHDIILLGRLDNGLGLYRFRYIGSSRVYVGVMAQEVQPIMPEAVERGRDGYLKVNYDKLGLTFQTYERWTASGVRLPTVTPRH